VFCTGKTLPSFNMSSQLLFLDFFHRVYCRQVFLLTRPRFSLFHPHPPREFLLLSTAGSVCKLLSNCRPPARQGSRQLLFLVFSLEPPSQRRRSRSSRTSGRRAGGRASGSKGRKGEQPWWVTDGKSYECWLSDPVFQTRLGQTTETKLYEWPHHRLG
jgi:hypothetical protein